jgi:4-deoxy-L-threo-5-hexosulose-uronate ketol-isomerase
MEDLHMRFMPRPEQARRMTTDELRSTFLVTDLFRTGKVGFQAVDLDRVVLGGAVPGEAPLSLDAPDALAADYFAERRELGILNVGGPGAIDVDGTSHRMEPRDVLYVGRGSRSVVLSSDGADDPARYYLVSYPAHGEYPTARVSYDEAEVSEIGSEEGASRRRIRKYIHEGGAASSQLVMGITELEAGSVWNTMPAHTHQRRTEVYMYFDLPGDDAVFHLMGEPHETRSIVVRNEQAVLSPAWSIHAGCGTRSYTFCWAMGGENQEFGDMQPAAIPELR